MQHDAALVAVIDDDDAVRDAVTGLLRSVGIGSMAFASAEEFLQSAPFGQLHGIITDCVMTGMSGIELFELLRARGDNIPVILATAYSTADLLRRAASAGITHCLNKPFTDRDLLDCLDDALKSNDRLPGRLDGAE